MDTWSHYSLQPMLLIASTINCICFHNFFFCAADDIPASLCRGHRRALCMDGRYGQRHRRGESPHCHPQPNCKCLPSMTSSLPCSVQAVVQLHKQRTSVCQKNNTCSTRLYFINFTFCKLWVFISVHSIFMNLPVDLLISDWALPTIWVYLWRNATEGEHPYWKTGGRRNVG